MKKLLYLASILLIGGSQLTGCQHPPTSAPEQTSHALTAGGKADAHPAWTFMAPGSSVWTIAVSDSDGSDRATIYTSADYTAHQSRFPSWSPNGASVSFVEAPAPTSTWYSGLPWGPCSI